MKRSHRFWSALILCPLAAAPVAHARELSLAQALDTAERASPRLAAGRLREDAAHAAVAAERAAYAPAIDADAIDSWGFPGSSSFLREHGLVASPYRSGPAFDLAAKQTIYDFGRTRSRVRQALEAEQIRRDDTAIDKVQLDLDVLRTFFECGRFRSEHAVWDQVHGETEIVAREVLHFVNTGQRSLVDRYLAQSQVEEARTNRNYFASRMNSTLARLALLMGTSPSGLSCPALPALEEGIPLRPTRDINPTLRRSQTQVEEAKTRIAAVKAGLWPRIIGIASAGTMERSRLVPATDYSGAFGFILPLFDGLGTLDRLDEAKARLRAREQEAAAVRLDLDETNARYDEIIDASRARIEHLEAEERLAQEGFNVAKNRYFKFQGTLVDLRDALRNLGRIQAELKDTQADLLISSGLKALTNGAAPR